jgi:hypothetical protein
MPDEEPRWDRLSDREARFVSRIIHDLAGTPWARPLLTDIERGGGLTRANKTRFFELRFGYTLHQAGIDLRYEAPGENQSTLDFGFTCAGRNWLVELMRLEETQATHNHLDEDGVQWASLHLSTDAENPKHSIEGEALKAVERICQKCEHDGRSHKFPVPDDAYHVILVDIRTFLDGIDAQDLIHVALGGEHANKEMPRLRWKGKLISGVFDKETPVRGAREACERVHFLGFVRETEFEDGAFAASTQFIANPHLFEATQDVRAAIATWPLQPTKVLNGH